MHHRAVASISRRFVATRASASMRVQHDAAVFAAASGLTSSSAFVLKPQTLIFETTNNNTATIASTLRTFGTTTTTNDAAAAAKDCQAFLESLSPAEKKFLDVLHEYRNKNFEHTMPKRFLSMIIKAVDSNQDGVITMEEYQTLLINIGARETMTDHDLDELFKTLGDDELEGEKVITVQSIEAAWTPYLNVVWKL